MDSVWASYIFSFLFGFGTCFQATTYVPYLLSLGLSMSEITLVNALFWLTISVAEVPTGMLADGKSRRWSMKMGIALLISSIVIYLTIQTLWAVFVAELLGGIGLAFLSGSKEAWIADALKQRGEFKRLKEVVARSFVANMVGALLAGSIGGFIGTVSLRVPLLLDAIILLGLLVFVHYAMTAEGEPVHKVSERQALMSGLRAFRSEQGLRWLAICSMVSGLILPLHLGWAEFFRIKLGVGAMPYLWVFMLVIVMCPGLLLQRIGIGKHRGATAICFSLLFMGMGLVFLGVTRSATLLIFAMGVQEFGSGALRVTTEVYLQKRAESEHRATSGSLQSLFGRFGNALALGGATLMLGGPFEPARIQTVWFVVGAILIGAVCLLWVFRPRLQDS